MKTKRDKDFTTSVYRRHLCNRTRFQNNTKNMVMNKTLEIISLIIRRWKSKSKKEIRLLQTLL